MATYETVSYSNGAAPASILAQLDDQPDAFLRRDAADAWNRARRDVLARTGITLTVRGWNRTLAEQERFFFERYYPSATGTLDPRWYKGVRYVRNPAHASAAIPGTSNHGWGLAVDVVDYGNVGQFGYPRRAATFPILAAHGWTDAEGRGDIQEPWHLVYDPTRDTHPTVQEDDDMADLTPQNLTDIANAVWGHTLTHAGLSAPAVVFAVDTRIIAGQAKAAAENIAVTLTDDQVAALAAVLGPEVAGHVAGVLAGLTVVSDVRSTVTGTLVPAT